MENRRPWQHLEVVCKLQLSTIPSQKELVEPLEKKDPSSIASTHRDAQELKYPIMLQIYIEIRDLHIYHVHL